MAQSGRKSITIDAPVMITSNKIAVWMDENWMHNFFDFIILFRCAIIVFAACLVNVFRPLIFESSIAVAALERKSKLKAVDFTQIRDALVEQLKSRAAKIEESACMGIYGKTNAWSEIPRSDVPPAHECVKTALISH